MAKNSKKKIVLLDTHAIIHRAYHALPSFSTSDGIPTGALFGVCTMLIKILSELKPDYVIAAYDLPGGTFRSEVDSTYKANRGEAEEDLIEQINRSRDILEAFAIPIYEKKGYEADDVLGTLAEQLKQDDNNQIIIASGDMDTLQLVDKKQVQVYTLKKGINDTIMYDHDAVVERFGFEPKFLPDYKGLRGDPSDNIIGVKGVGEKTATTLVCEFGTIEDMYTKLHKDEQVLIDAGVTKRIAGILRDSEEEALFSKTLATIVRDVPVDIQLPEKEWKESIDLAQVKELFNQYEFRNLFSRVAALFPEFKDGEQAVMDVDDDTVLSLAVRLWILDSERTDATLDEIYTFTKTNNPVNAGKVLDEKLKKEKLYHIFSDIEQEVIPISQAMTKRGITIDQERLAELSKKFTKQLEGLEKKIFTLAGKEFNVRSSQQLSEILFDELGLPTTKIKKNKNGYYSTNSDVLEKLEDAHEIVPLVVEYREIQKLLSTYVDAFSDLVQDDGKIHARFLQHGTTTGRFSSKDPNMQNIPIKTESGRMIREVFVASPGCMLVAFDYSQIELRVTAMLSEDPYMIEVFQSGGDIHSAVASRVFNVSEKDVTPEMRRRAKVINFGIIYGMGVTALQKNLGTDRKEAQQFYNDYFESFGTIKEYLEGVKEFTRKHGYTETLFGRRRYFKNINSNIPYIRALAERMAINAPIQGTATADIIKLAMVAIKKAIRKAGFSDKVWPLLQIHDEMIYEVHLSVVTEVMSIIETEMKNVFEYAPVKPDVLVPLEVHSSKGERMSDLK